ncbi:YALIA101S10e02168g1_1 [Yarrowia lipolytica]|nr:Hypothetical protein YALI2_A00044g [Yarrowia lipolytica]SEI36160.1 YALIA101S10e02168g1_1 [Yarrowia lipolytica]
MKLAQFAVWLAPAAAIYFSDCFHQRNNPLGLSWTPDSVFADYDKDDGRLHFSVTGTVSGAVLSDLNETENKYTTLNSQSRSMKGLFVDNYTRFCDEVSKDTKPETCPIQPGQEASFAYTVEVPEVARRISDIATIFKIISPVDNGDGLVVGCVEIQTSPVIDKGTIYAVIFSTLGVSIVVFVATFGVQSFSTWSRLNTGSDSDLDTSSPHATMKASILAQFTGLVAYWQFAFFVACLNLNYAGAYQAVASGFGWAALTFGKSFTSDVIESADPANGLYNFHTPGMPAMATIVGLHDNRDIWPGFIIWFLVIFGATIIAMCVSQCLAGRTSFASLLTGLAKTTITVVYSLLALPLLALSFYQLQAGGTLTVAKVLSGLIVGFWALGGIYFCWSVSQGRNGDLGCFTGCMKPSTSSAFRASIVFVELAHVYLLGVCIGVLQSSGVAQVAFLGTLEFLIFAITLIVAPYVFSRLSALVALFRMIISLLSIVYIRSLDTSLSLKIIMGIVIMVLHLVVCLSFLFFAGLLIFRPRFRSQSSPVSSSSSFNINSKSVSPVNGDTLLGQYNDDLNSQSEKRASIRENIRFQPEMYERPMSGLQDHLKGHVQDVQSPQDLGLADMDFDFEDERPMHQRPVSGHKRSMSGNERPLSGSLTGSRPTSDLYERRQDRRRRSSASGHRKSLTIDTSALVKSHTNPSPALPNPPALKTVADRVVASPHTYYRPPRRRSEDRTSTATPQTPEVPVLPSPHVDYTQREADIYKRSSTMCEDYDLGGVGSHDALHKSTSHLISKTRSADEVINKHERKLFQPKTWIKPEEDPLEPKGFEVVGRGK